MANLRAVYYRSPDGSEPVSDFIDGLDPRRQVALDNQIDRLNMLTPACPQGRELARESSSDLAAVSAKVDRAAFAQICRRLIATSSVRDEIPSLPKT